MTDVPSSLGIEAVECLAEGGRSVTVRVTGRWRRRRPELRGQPMLVVDAPGGRQRFLAMPEPPSLTGAAPGTWRMSFSVPAELARSLPGRTFLQLGGALVPLPIGDVPTTAQPSPPRLATEAAGGVARLERALDEAHAQSDRLREEITDRDRRLRTAEQHVHSERALRAEVEQQLSQRSRAAEHDLRVLHERVAELEGELTRMRRAVDEAQHLAAAAEAGRADAVRRLADSERPPPRSPQTDAVRLELELAQGFRGVAASRAPRQPERAGDREALRQEAMMAAARVAGAGVDADRIATLEHELAAAHEELEIQRRRSARAWEAIELVRGELRQLCAAAAATTTTAAQPAAAVPAASPPATNPPATNPPATNPPAATPPAMTAPAMTAPAVAAPAASPPLQAEQLSAALARLRQQAPAADPPAPAESTPLSQPQPPAATKPWLTAAFRKLAGQDASAAGRLLLALLPAQHAADPHPVAYDLVMSDVLVAHVTVGSAGANVELDATTRPLSEVDFQLVGDLARIGRLLAAGPVRRRLGGLAPGRPVARVRGDRARVAALDALLGARLTLAQLVAAGVRLDPLLALTLAGLMTEPAWTAGERFTLAHREAATPAPDAHLLVRDGRSPLASVEPPHEPVATVLVCPADQLLAVLGGALAPDAVEGEERPVSLLRQWLVRAQCG
jgi:hypothetical protein